MNCIGIKLVLVTSFLLFSFMQASSQSYETQFEKPLSRVLNEISKRIEVNVGSGGEKQMV